MNRIYESGWLNKLLVVIAIGGIVTAFLGQEFLFLQGWNLSEQNEFIARKVLRVFLNDLFMLVFIAAWFKDSRVTRLAILIQLVDSLILLPLYLVVKLNVEGPGEISAPLLSQFHRMIINPTLMILLIPAVYFQRYSKGS
ncbi:MAG: exosortase F system-associated protein [Bacteroidetes bacterium]|nr:exosortase F system-associated protein [Bacteroidota bacterium]MBI3481956.1 exosortase F system-associated protein [Bacteroidota bacterium]